MKNQLIDAAREEKAQKLCAQRIETMSLERHENRYFIFDKPADPGIKGLTKKAFWRLLSVKYKLQMSLFHPDAAEKQYNVSVCAIFKNEAPYLKEWLEFNHIVGIEHFYMYNNNSEDDFRQVLEPYIASGLVTLIEWPHKQKQMECYMDCIERFGGETKWLGFIDIDEFVVPKSTDNVYDFLKPFEKNRGSVNIYWRLFGSSGRTDRDMHGLVSEDFVVCWPKYCDIGKCFYNTAYGFDRNSEHSKMLHHKFWASWKGKDIPPVNIFDAVCVGNINRANTEEFPIQINHYFTKSYQEYAMKRAKGDVYFQINPHDEAYFYEHEMKCTAVDYSAYKYLIKLKKAMEGPGDGTGNGQR